MLYPNDKVRFKSQYSHRMYKLIGLTQASDECKEKFKKLEGFEDSIGVVRNVWDKNKSIFGPTPSCYEAVVEFNNGLESIKMKVNVVELELVTEKEDQFNARW